MSQMHSHGPGQPSHSHGPPQPQQQQQQQVMRPPDPVMQRIIEDSYVPVNVVLSGPPENSIVLCAPHSLEKCADCDTDYTALNRISKTLQMNPNLRCPPPPNIISQKLSQAINTTKEEGNTLFKSGKRDMAIQRYTMAANIAAQRPPWEASQLMREEISTVVSNRSVAYLEQGDAVSALADAETVITLKRPWSKGHFRKAKALMQMEQWDDAKDAIQLGLCFEPGNPEMTQILTEVQTAITKRAEESQRRRQQPEKTPVSTTVDA